MFVKGLVVVIMLAILFCLGSGLFYLINDKGQGNRTVKALSWRIGISLTLFILLFIAFALGLIHPHGVAPN